MSPSDDRRRWIIPIQGLSSGIIRAGAIAMDRAKRKAIHQYAAKFRKGMIGRDSSDGWCFCLCTALQGALSFEFRQPTDLLILDFPATNHVVLRLEENLILDPTADQFPETGQKGVYLGPLPQIYRQWITEYHGPKKRPCELNS